MSFTQFKALKVNLLTQNTSRDRITGVSGTNMQSNSIYRWVVYVWRSLSPRKGLKCENECWYRCEIECMQMLTPVTRNKWSSAPVVTLNVPLWLHHRPFLPSHLLCLHERRSWDGSWSQSRLNLKCIISALWMYNLIVSQCDASSARKLTERYQNHQLSWREAKRGQINKWSDSCALILRQAEIGFIWINPPTVWSKLYSYHC